MARASKATNDDTDFTPFSLDPDPSYTVKEESPLETTKSTYTPTDKEKVIKGVPPAKWESLISILELLTKDSDDSVIIKDSVIMHSLHGVIVKADLSKAFDDEKINLHISSPKKWVRLFKQFKNDTVYIIDNSERNCFIVTNGEIRLFLPKQVQSVVSNLFIPNLENTKTVSKFKISKEVRDKILNLSKGVEYLEYLIQDDLIKCVNIPNTAIYVFPEFLTDEKIKKLDSNNADLTLRSSAFLPISADEYSIIIGRRDDTTYFSYTTCKTGFLSIELYENLDDASGANIFI